MASRLQLEADGPVIDPEQRAWVDAVALDLRAAQRRSVEGERLLVEGAGEYRGPGLDRPPCLAGQAGLSRCAGLALQRRHES